MRRWPTATRTATGPFQPGPALPGLLPADLSQRPIGADQSNTTVVVGERLALKMYRRLESGLHPDIEIGRHLTERAQRRLRPRLRGCVRWGDHAHRDAAGIRPGAEDGWAWAAAAVQEGDVSRLRPPGSATRRTLHGALAQIESRRATPRTS